MTEIGRLWTRKICPVHRRHVVQRKENDASRTGDVVGQGSVVWAFGGSGGWGRGGVLVVGEGEGGLV